MKLYRRHLVGLPLQRSTFSDLDRAAALIGVGDVLPAARTLARLSDAGDLFLDRAAVNDVEAAIAGRLTPTFLDGMERSLIGACDAVLHATERSRARAATADSNEARILIRDLGANLRALVPFGVLSKFVPDVLYRVMATASPAGLPSLRAETPGATLTRDAFALFCECRDCGFTPDRMLAEWPDVPAIVADRVEEFCRCHAGFGPLRWESPGYESPRYVFGILRASFAADDSDDVIRGLDRGAREREAVEAKRSAAAEDAMLRVLVAWLDFLERETWYIRRAFLLGLRPLLLRLAPECLRRSPQMVLEDLLFLTLDELDEPRPDMELASARRNRYRANRQYLVTHGIQDERLAAVMEAA